MANYYKSGGSESEASAAWAAYSSSADGGSSFQFPPAGEASGSDNYLMLGSRVIAWMVRLLILDKMVDQAVGGLESHSQYQSRADLVPQCQRRAKYY